MKLTGDAGGAVNKDENHAAEGPGDAENPNAAALVAAVVGVALNFVADYRQHGDVEEEKRGDELGDQSSVEGPLLELVEVHERRRRRIVVVLG